MSPAYAAPVMSIAGTLNSLAVSTSESLAGLSVSDAYAAATGGTVTVQLADQTGTLSDSDHTSGSGTGTLVISGSVAAVNAELATVRYAAGAKPGTDTVVMTAGDSMGLADGAGGTVGVTVTPAYAAPVMSIAGTLNSLAVSTSESLAGLSVSDAYAAATGGTVTVQLADQTGTLSDSDHTSGSGTGTLVISGSVAAVNAELATVRYAAGAKPGTDTVVMTAGDSMGLADGAGGTVGVTVTPAYAAPVMSIAGTLNSLAVSTSESLAGLSVSDAYAAATGGTVTVQLADQTGTLSDSDHTSGSGTGTLVISGSVAAVNAELATVRYAAGAKPGTDTIVMTAGDSMGLADGAGGTVGVTSYQPVGTTASTSQLVFTVSEDAYKGNAEFIVTVDGEQFGGTQTATASHAAGATNQIILNGSFIAAAHTIGVDFINDAYGGSAALDRNLYINNITLNGLQATGLSSGPVAELHNGTVNFAIPGQVNIGSGPDVLLLNVSEDAYKGDAQFTVFVDGQQVGGIQTATASHAAGASNQTTLYGFFGTGVHTISLDFLNDLYGGMASEDRNLYVSSASIDGRGATGVPAELSMDGVKSFTVPAVPTPPAPVTPTPSALIYYLASGAATGGDGSAAHPFSTFNQAELAMRNSTIKTVDVEAGSYNLTSPLTLTSADSGETFVAASGVTATVTGSGLTNLIDITGGAKNITIQGLSLSGTAASPSSDGDGAIDVNGSSSNSIIANHFQNVGGVGVLLEEGSDSNTLSGNELANSADSAIEIKDSSNSNLVDSNLIDGVSAPDTNGGGVFMHGVSNNTVSHNLIQNTAGMGIGLDDYGPGTNTQNSGNVISYNELTNNDTASSDSGAIYILGRSDTNSSTTINMNFISGPSGTAIHHLVGIYLDDYSSGVSVTNNIVTGSGLDDDFQIHGGNNDLINNNVFDTGFTAARVGLIQAAPTNVGMGLLGTFNNDVVDGNLNVSEHTTSGTPSAFAYVDAALTSVKITNNDFFGGNGMNAQPDSAPKYMSQGFANEPGGNYSFTAGSGAASIGFKAINQALEGLHPAGSHYYP